MVLLGNGDGTFEVASIVDPGVVGVVPRCVAIGDLNGDGTRDLVVGKTNFVKLVSVMLGNGDGTFGGRTDYGTGSDAVSVAIGDLNVDGRPDLAVATAGWGSVVLGHGD